MRTAEATFIEQVMRDLGISNEQLQEAQNLARAKSILLVHALIRLKFANPVQMLNIFGTCYGFEVTDLDSMDIPQNIIDLIPPEIATKMKIIPIDRAGQNLIVAVSDPNDLKLLDLIRFKTGYSPKPVLASEVSIAGALNRHYKSKDIALTASDKEEIARAGFKSQTEDRAVIGEQRGPQDENGGAIIKIVDQLLMMCLARRASDIHIEPYETMLRIRMRVDGVLQEVARPPIELRNPIISRIKIMSRMNIAEKRLPQDGGIRVVIEGKPIDFRVSSCPTIYGEKVVMRILDKSALQVDMTKLGLEPDDFERFNDAIRRPYGMVLVTGPTGSGKTTTLYSALSELNKKTVNLLTAEDPVEFNIEGINQIQVLPQIDFTFATALRAFLRQDPDIIMVGEIRDGETAEIAVKAALTGHLVLSTLHTNSAADTVIRLTNIGVEAFNLVSSLNAIVAQRLVRKICKKCRQPDPSIKPEHLIQLGIPANYANQIQAYKGVGCHSCSQSGYKGRIAIFEVMSIFDPIKEAILQHKSAFDIKKIAQKMGMRTLRQNALRKLASGETDVLEVIKTTASDDNQAAESENNAA